MTTLWAVSDVSLQTPRRRLAGSSQPAGPAQTPVLPAQVAPEQLLLIVSQGRR